MSRRTERELSDFVPTFRKEEQKGPNRNAANSIFIGISEFNLDLTSDECEWRYVVPPRRSETSQGLLRHSSQADC
jgi:hypothetical protein